MFPIDYVDGVPTSSVMPRRKRRQRRAVGITIVCMSTGILIAAIVAAKLPRLRASDRAPNPRKSARHGLNSHLGEAANHAALRET
jgi:hypothetical protein